MFVPRVRRGDRGHADVLSAHPRASVRIRNHTVPSAARATRGLCKARWSVRGRALAGTARAVEDGGAQFLPFPLLQWLILEQPNGKRLFVRPSTVKYYEEL